MLECMRSWQEVMCMKDTERTRQLDADTVRLPPWRPRCLRLSPWGLSATCWKPHWQKILPLFVDPILPFVHHSQVQGEIPNAVVSDAQRYMSHISI